ncbi:MAG: uracil-DNA glycosylase family protein [Bacteroidales bacterium]|nr:uracil-DNA glycosylase family protein [Bacteroidales bacterium]
MNEIETHPFAPYIPAEAHFLFLGTFPPKAEKWSMEFFYPNKINDMWRIMGLIFYADRNHFWNSAERRFEVEPIKRFLDERRIAMYDTAQRVRRLKDNASDKFLEIVEPVNLEKLLAAAPGMKVVVTTGEKAASVVAELTGTKLPAVGEWVEIAVAGRTLRHYRMPSTSRAYPLPIEKKASAYAAMLRAEGMNEVLRP